VFGRTIVYNGAKCDCGRRSRENIQLPLDPVAGFKGAAPLRGGEEEWRKGEGSGEGEGTRVTER